MRYSYGRALKIGYPLNYSQIMKFYVNGYTLVIKSLLILFLTKQYQDAAVSLKMDI